MRFLGNVKVEKFNKNGNNLTAKIEVLEDKTILELPYVYYSGYDVTLDGSKVRAFESENGFLAIGLNKISKTDLKVEYNSNLGIKIFSLICFILFVVYNIIEKRVNVDKTEKSIEN